MEEFLKPSLKYIYLTPIILFMAFAFAWKVIVHPRIVTWALEQTPKINASQDFVDLQIGNLDFSLLKLQATVDHVQVRFKNELKNYSPLSIERIKIQVNPFELLVGQLNITSVQIENFNWDLDESVFASNSKPKALPLDMIFRYLPEVPVEKIRFLNPLVNFKLKHNQLTLTSRARSLSLENLKSRIVLEITDLAQNIRFENTSSFEILGQLNASLNSDTLRIQRLALKAIDSDLLLSGDITDFKNVLIQPSGQLTLESTVFCDNLRTFYLTLFPQKSRFPTLAGKIQSTGKVIFRGRDDINGQFEMNTLNLSMNQFKFGSARIKSQIKKNQLLIDQIFIEHLSGTAQLNEIEIDQKKPFLFKTKLDVKSFNLQKLFVSLGLNNIPANLDLTGAANCAGQLLPPFDIECQTTADISNVDIKPSLKKKFSIVKLKKSTLTGTVFFNNEDIQFDSQVLIGKSSGLAKGIVDFEKGFKIDFETEQLHLQDVESLAGLDINGDLKLKGSTEGTSDHGRLEIEVSAQNAVIEKFLLGNFSTELVYEKSHLYFRKVSGFLGSSDFKGQLEFDFNNSLLEGNFASQKLHGEDIHSSLTNKFQLPIEWSGQGAADVEFSGPFDFWKLAYSVRSHLRQGQIADESFDRLDFNLSSDGQRIKFNDVQIRKLKSLVSLDGSIETLKKIPEYNLILRTQNSFIEEFDSILKFVPTLTGQFSLNGKITGSLPSPEVLVDFNTKQVTLEGFSYPPSQGQIGINRRFFIFDGQLFGRQIQSHLRYPWNPQNDFEIKMQIRDLNPLLLLPLMSLPQPSSEFHSRLSLDMDLRGPQTTLAQTNGTIRLSDFLLQRGTHTLKLKSPSTLIFDKGLRRMDTIDLIGAENQLSFKLVSTSKTETRIDISTMLKLRVLQFLVPFVNTLNGQLEAQARVHLNSGPIQIFGDGQLTDGVLQLKGFPTAIENIRSPIEFSQSKIFLNDIRANLGQSEVRGSGHVEIKGPRNIPVHLQAQADNLELTFPDKVTTAGRAQLEFFGSWLPYNLKVNYKVNRGLVEKDFGEDSSDGTTTIKASHFLPPQQLQAKTPSLLLDISVDGSSGVVVKNKLVEGTANGVLKITGSPENPILLGKIEISPGSKIIFKDKPFEIQTANLQFDGSSNNLPDIYISALARIAEYDVNLLIQGIPNKNLAIKPSSQPPLSESDIFSLLALGMTSTKMDQNLSSEAQQQQTSIELLASITNQSTINKKIQEKLGLTVQLAPSVDSTRNIAVPKVVVSKKILKKLNASYARPLSGENQNNEVKLHYLFNPNWSGILNYQNKESDEKDGTIQNQNQTEGIFGGDFEYKKEFKW